MRRAARLPLALVLIASLAGCTATKPPAPPAGAQPKVGDEWFVWRASTLGIPVEEARSRDAALPDGSDETAPPEGTLDEHTAAQAALLWRAECARCHGESGEAPPAASGTVQPRSWTGMGPTMGFLFGGDAMRAGIYDTIARGKGTMAGWGDVLSREQMWALVAHVESF
jgi:mono/diheme cytochrome c family protein